MKGLKREFSHFGVMLDMSRNAVMRIDQIKKWIDILPKMGYNCLQLYTEDTFEIDDEPYFGYLRGRYTGAELKELDEYAKARGVELIPCVQTLAHFACLVRHSTYQSFVDVNDILLIDDDRTYALIDKIFATLAENYTSRTVNIGMDEAHMVGLGRYLDKNGYHDRFGLLVRHLNKVVDIAEKYGFKPQMWSDMFFRLASKEIYDDDSPDSSKHYPKSVPDLAGNGYYVDKPLHFKQELLDKVPKNVDLVYWDYYNVDEKVYDAMFASHLKFSRKIWFAGGAWCWNGFAPHNRYSLKSMKRAMESVQKYGVSDVMITLWGDDGKECSYFSTLPALYAIRQYAEGNFNHQKIAEGFYELFGVEFDDFMALDIANGEMVLTGRNGEEFPQNPCKSLLYNDPFLGLMDKVVETEAPIPYKEYASRLHEIEARAGEYAYLFEMEADLCEVLSLKADLGVRTRRIYQSGDKKALAKLIEDYEQISKSLEKFQRSFTYLWNKENKPYGLEVQQIRLGGLAVRVKFCGERLQAYLDGKTERIEELEESILSENPSWYFYCNRYQHLATFGLLSE